MLGCQHQPSADLLVLARCLLTTPTTDEKWNTPAEAASSESLHADVRPTVVSASLLRCHFGRLQRPAAVRNQKWVLQWAECQCRDAHSFNASVEVLAASMVQAVWSSRRLYTAEAQAVMLIPLSRSP